jgi:hypothetical protein
MIMSGHIKLYDIGAVHPNTNIDHREIKIEHEKHRRAVEFEDNTRLMDNAYNKNKL